MAPERLTRGSSLVEGVIIFGDTIRELQDDIKNYQSAIESLNNIVRTKDRLLLAANNTIKELSSTLGKTDQVLREALNSLATAGNKVDLLRNALQKIVDSGSGTFRQIARAALEDIK